MSPEHFLCFGVLAAAMLAIIVDVFRAGDY